MKLSETIQEVIRLADASRQYWDRELPKRHPDYPLVHPGEDSGPPPPQEIKLRSLLATLPKDVIYKLISIMYLGQGFFGTENLDEELEQLKITFPKPDMAANQMMENALLDEYLSEGLSKLRDANIHLDDWRLRPAKSRK